MREIQLFKKGDRVRFKDMDEYSLPLCEDFVELLSGGIHIVTIGGTRCSDGRPTITTDRTGDAWFLSERFELLPPEEGEL